jgi:hypothetical protein
LVVAPARSYFFMLLSVGRRGGKGVTKRTCCEWRRSGAVPCCTYVVYAGLQHADAHAAFNEI